MLGLLCTLGSECALQTLNLSCNWLSNTKSFTNAQLGNSFTGRRAGSGADGSTMQTGGAGYLLPGKTGKCFLDPNVSETF